MGVNLLLFVGPAPFGFVTGTVDGICQQAQFFQSTLAFFLIPALHIGHLPGDGDYRSFAHFIFLLKCNIYVIRNAVIQFHGTVSVPVPSGPAAENQYSA